MFAFASPDQDRPYFSSQAKLVERHLPLGNLLEVLFRVPKRLEDRRELGSMPLGVPVDTDGPAIGVEGVLGFDIGHESPSRWIVWAVLGRQHSLPASEASADAAPALRGVEMLARLADRETPLLLFVRDRDLLPVHGRRNHAAGGLSGVAELLEERRIGWGDAKFRCNMLLFQHNMLLFRNSRIVYWIVVQSVLG